MNYSNAYSSIKKLIFGEVLGMVSIIVYFLNSFFSSIITYAFQYENNTIVNNLLFVVSALTFICGITTMVSGIIQFIGLVKIRKLDKKFNEAIIMIVIIFICTIIRDVVPDSLGGIISIISEISDLWIAVAIIQGFVNITDDLNDYELSDEGLKVLKKAITFLSIKIFCSIVFEYIISNPSFFIGIIILMSVITIIQIVAYIYYIRYLIHMKKYFGEKKEFC